MDHADDMPPPPPAVSPPRSPPGAAPLPVHLLGDDQHHVVAPVPGGRTLTGDGTAFHIVSSSSSAGARPAPLPLSVPPTVPSCDLAALPPAAPPLAPDTLTIPREPTTHHVEDDGALEPEASQPAARFPSRISSRVSSRRSDLAYSNDSGVESPSPLGIPDDDTHDPVGAPPAPPASVWDAPPAAPAVKASEEARKAPPRRPPGPPPHATVDDVLRKYEKPTLSAAYPPSTTVVAPEASLSEPAPAATPAPAFNLPQIPPIAPLPAAVAVLPPSIVTKLPAPSPVAVPSSPASSSALTSPKSPGPLRARASEPTTSQLLNALRNTEQYRQQVMLWHQQQRSLEMQPLETEEPAAPSVESAEESVMEVFNRLAAAHDRLRVLILTTQAFELGLPVAGSLHSVGSLIVSALRKAVQECRGALVSALEEADAVRDEACGYGPESTHTLIAKALPKGLAHTLRQQSGAAQMKLPAAPASPTRAALLPHKLVTDVRGRGGVEEGNSRVPVHALCADVSLLELHAVVEAAGAAKITTSGLERFPDVFGEAEAAVATLCEEARQECIRNTTDALGRAKRAVRKLTKAVAARKVTLAGLSAAKREVAQGHRTLREEHAQLCARHEGDVAAMEKGLRAVEAGLMPSLYTAIAQAEAEAKEERAGWGMTRLDDVIAVTADALRQLTSAPHPDLLALNERISEQEDGAWRLHAAQTALAETESKAEELRRAIAATQAAIDNANAAHKEVQELTRMKRVVRGLWLKHRVSTLETVPFLQQCLQCALYTPSLHAELIAARDSLIAQAAAQRVAEAPSKLLESPPEEDTPPQWVEEGKAPSPLPVGRRASKMDVLLEFRDVIRDKLGIGRK